MSIIGKFIPGNDINNTLYKSIYICDVEKVNVIIDLYGLSYSESWEEGFDLILTAVECKHFDIAKLLLEKGCRLKSAQNGTGISRSLIHTAVNVGDVELIGMLLDRDESLLTKIEQSHSPLHVAVANGQRKIVNLFLERGADIEVRNDVGMAPLHFASLSEHIEILELLLVSGADIESQDNSGKTSLFSAVSSGNLTAVKVLLKEGANCNCKSKTGSFPLFDATLKGYEKIVKELLLFGADFNEKNASGQTSLHIACMQKNKNLIVSLLGAGADINATDSFGMVPCDAIMSKSFVPSFMETSAINYVMAKHFSILKTGNFDLNYKNQMFYDVYYDMYCNELGFGSELLFPTSGSLPSIIKSCKEEIDLMKKTKSDSGFTFYDVFKKLKNPLSVITTCEINFISSRSVGLSNEKEFNLYEWIIRNLLKRAKLRNDLLTIGQDCFSSLIHLSEKKLPTLPEEMSIFIISHLSNEDLQQLIKCSKEIEGSIVSEGLSYMKLENED